MEVTKTISVELTPDEVSDIIKTYLFKNKNINVDSVYFRVDTVLDDDEYDDRYSSYQLTKIECDGVIEND